MKTIYLVLALLLTMGSVNAAPPFLGGSGDQNNQQNVRTSVDTTVRQNQRQQQQQSQRQRTSQEQTAQGGRGGAGGQGGTSNSWADANSNSDSYANNDGNNTAISYENDYKDTYEKYVAAAYAPPLVASGDCLGSASAGGSNSVMGISLGKTYVDENCNARYDAALLWSMGRKGAAVQRLCSQPEMAKVIPECPEPEVTVYNGWDD